MSEMISLTGIVISSMPVGEYDNRIVLLTKERGKICAFAKGSRRMHSSLTGLVRPFLMGRFELYEGRDAYTLTGGESKEYFEELSKDLVGVYYGFYFLEIADYYSREGIEGTNMLNLLYMSFKALINKNIDNDLIKLIFEFKAMVINGEYPEVFECVKCKSATGITHFSLIQGGGICTKCRTNVFDSFTISNDLLYTMQYIILAKLDKLYTFTLKDTVLAEFEKMMKVLRKANFDKHFKSLDILETMKI